MFKRVAGEGRDELCPAADEFWLGQDITEAVSGPAQPKTDRYVYANK